MTLGLLVAAWLAGVVIGFQLEVAVLPALLLALATLAGGIWLRVCGRSLWPAAMAGLLLLGLLRVEAGPGLPAPLAPDDVGEVTVVGRIVNDPEATGQKIKFVIKTESVDGGAGPVRLTTRTLVYADPPDSLVLSRTSPYFRYGDGLEIEGELESPEQLQDLDYAAYLSNQGISGILWAREVKHLEGSRGGSAWRRWIFDLRKRLSDSIGNTFNEPHAAVAQALLLGQREALPDDVVESFRKTGTSHILAISGLHVGVVLAMSLGVAGAAFGRRWQLYLLLPLLAVWMYALVSGLPISVVRAGIMASVYLVAVALGRPRSALPALAFSAAVIIAVSPQALNQVSFQLSFAAMAGIALASSYMARVTGALSRALGEGQSWIRSWTGRLSTLVVTGIVVSTAATLATWPLVAYNFDRIPLLGVVFTLLVLPVLPLVILGSLLAAFTGLAAPAVGQFFGWLTWAPLSYLLELISAAPGPTVGGEWVGEVMVGTWYAILAGLVFLMSGKLRTGSTRGVLGAVLGRLPAPGGARPRLPQAPVWVLGGALTLLAATVFVWAQVFSGPDGKLHIYVFNVGQGDSSLIVTPTGRQVLVDGGPNIDSAIIALNGPLAYSDRSLDILVLTHIDADHSRGLLRVLDRYDVGALILGVEDSSSPLHERLQAAIDRRGISVLSVREGYKVVLEPGISLEVLSPPTEPFRGTGSDRNNNGLVLRLSYGRVDFLLASDIEAPAENALLSQGFSLQSEFLKVAHHGSISSTSSAFLAEVSPAVAVVSVGAENRFGHPDPEVVERLELTVGADRIYRTDRHGTVEFISDGVQLWVKPEH